MKTPLNSGLTYTLPLKALKPVYDLKGYILATQPQVFVNKCVLKDILMESYGFHSVYVHMDIRGTSIEQVFLTFDTEDVDLSENIIDFGVCRTRVWYPEREVRNLQFLVIDELRGIVNESRQCVVVIHKWCQGIRLSEDLEYMILKYFCLLNFRVIGVP